MQAKVIHHQDTVLQELGGGTSRKVLAYNDQMMIVEVHMEVGAIGAAHRHPHMQSTYVQSGRFRFTIDGEDVEVSQGDTIAFPSDILHGTVCLEKGVLLDIFTPMRADFL